MRPHDYWQRIDPAGAFSSGLGEDRYVVDLDGGGQLVLPVRTFADGKRGLASLIINQASFAAQDRLAGDLARRLEPFRPEIVVGLPTLGLALASAVARALGHERYVPLGTSRKFWYRDKLSAPLSSVTTPDQKKTLYLDPGMTRVLEGRRVAPGRRRDFERRLHRGGDSAHDPDRRRAGRDRRRDASIVALAGESRSEGQGKNRRALLDADAGEGAGRTMASRRAGGAGSTESGTRRTALSMTAHEDNGASPTGAPSLPPTMLWRAGRRRSWWKAICSCSCGRGKPFAPRSASARTSEATFPRDEWREAGSCAPAVFCPSISVAAAPRRVGLSPR